MSLKVKWPSGCASHAVTYATGFIDVFYVSQIQIDTISATLTALLYNNAMQSAFIQAVL